MLYGVYSTPWDRQREKDNSEEWACPLGRARRERESRRGLSSPGACAPPLPRPPAPGNSPGCPSRRSRAGRTPRTCRRPPSGSGSGSDSGPGPAAPASSMASSRARARRRCVRVGSPRAPSLRTSARPAPGAGPRPPRQRAAPPRRMPRRPRRPRGGPPRRRPHLGPRRQRAARLTTPETFSAGLRAAAG